MLSQSDGNLPRCEGNERKPLCAETLYALDCNMIGLP